MGSLSDGVKNWVQTALARWGYRISRMESCDALEFLLYCLLKEKQGALLLVQIGANDGVRADPIYRFISRNPARVRGLVVEPVKDYFEQLVANYRHIPGITPVNMAIHRHEKEMTMYRVDPAKAATLPPWTKGIASFDPSHYEQGDAIREALIPEVVKCTSLDELMKTHSLGNIDLLQIDTEGYDAEIIQGIDFNTQRPKIVRFEHGRLKMMSKGSFQRVRELLHAAGYELMIEPFDVTAYQPSIILDL